MSIKDLIPWKQKQGAPARREEGSPFFQLQREFNQLFDDFWGHWPEMPAAVPGAGDLFLPQLGLKETENTYVVSAELPGLDEKDITVELQGATLVIEGEKKEEHEEKKGDHVWSERRYGAFRRDVPLPAEVERDKIKAAFSKGVLTVTLPKSKAAKAARKKIEIKNG